MRQRPEIFHKGEAVPRKPRESGGTQEEIAISEKARLAFEKLFHAVEQEHKIPYLIFDIDGTLTPWGTDSQFNPKTLAEHVAENRDLVDTFKRRIHSLARRGFRSAISTGRPLHFAQKAARHLFPPDSVETIVAENGAVFARREDGKSATEAVVSYPSYFNREQLTSFQARCAPIIQFCERELGGSLAQEGKEAAITLIPRNADTLNDEGRDQFCRSIMVEAEREGLTSDVEVHRSKGSVDITPKGLTKVRALREVLNDNVGVYFGDSSSDEEAMGNVAVNVVPGNAFASTKAQAQKAQIGLVAERNDLKGVLDSLSMIEAYIRMRNIEKIRRAK